MDYLIKYEDGNEVLHSTLVKAAKAGLKAIYDELPPEERRIDVVKSVLGICRDEIIETQKILL